MADERLRAENEELRLRLEEAEETLRAIRSGAVDALVIEGAQEPKIYTLEGADRPYRILIEEMQQSAATISADGTIAYCNGRLEELLKLPHRKLIGATLRDFFAPDERPLCDELLEKGRTGTGQGEVHLCAADGALIPVLLTLNTLPEDCGAAIGLLMTDLTAQKSHEQLARAHQNLRERDERLLRVNAELAERLTELKRVNAELHESRRTALGLMNDAIQDRQLVEELNRRLHDEVGERVQIEQKLRQREQTLTRELTAAKALQRVSTQLNQANSVDPLYEHILDAAVAIMGSDFASMQRFDPVRGELQLLGSRGFSPEATQFWQRVQPGKSCSCGQSINTGCRSVVPDRETCEWIAGTEDLEMYRQIGIRAVQSTPLVSRGGLIVGVISTHWREPHEPGETELRTFDVLARQAADLIEREKFEDDRQRFVSLADNSSDFIAMCDLNLVPFYMNRAALEMVGLGTIEQVRATRVHEFFFPEDQERVTNEFFPEVLKNGGGEIEVRFRHFKTGEALWMLHNVWVVTDGHGEPVALATVSRNITERKRAEEALLRSERRFREMINALPAAVYTTDAEGCLTHFNPACVELSGRVPELGTDHWCVTWKLYHPDGTPMPHDKYPMAIALKEGRIVRGVEAITERPDGTCIWFQSYPMPLYDEAGKLIGGINMLMDITERKLADIVKNRLAAIVKSSDDAIISKDMNSVITSWNQGAERLFGYTADEAIGKSVTMLIPKDRLDEEPRILERLRRGESVDHFETTRVHKDGSLLELSLTISPLKDEQGRVIGASKIARDISERKRVEAALQEAGQRKDEFLATLSHELRTPLSAILGWTQIIERKPNDEKIVRRGIEAIARSSKAQASLISDLLDMSRIISGKMRLEIADVDLPLLVQSAVDSLQQTAEEKQIRINRSLDFSVTPVRGDASRLQQVFWNLLTNAVKFTPKDGLIQISLTQQTSRAIIAVSDSGQGIESDFLPFVFDRFRQADASASRAHGGLGLGLAIVKQLVELHGGKVRVASPGLGQGSTFTVELPLAAPPVTRDKDRAVSAKRSLQTLPSLKGIKVLAVDDDGDSRALLKQVLEECLAQVLTASSAEEALRMFGQYAPDILVSDIGMPHCDGYDFIHKVRACGHATSAIALTAFARSEDRMQALRAGYQAHLSKPINMSELITTIATFAKRPAYSGESR